LKEDGNILKFLLRNEKLKEFLIGKGPAANSKEETSEKF